MSDRNRAHLPVRLVGNLLPESVYRLPLCDPDADPDSHQHTNAAVRATHHNFHADTRGYDHSDTNAHTDVRTHRHTIL